jgi:DNA helicase-2/ATP-dependent DNA helicase PcrA
MDGTDAAILEGLTEPQRAAVQHIDGPLLVLAGPGSGKTTVVTRRVAYLISQGIPAWQILALTFTNKAAGEMRDRIDRMVPEDVPGRRGLTIATFHAFCARLLRRYAEFAGIDQRFTIYDSADQRAAIKQAIKAADLNERNFTPGAVGAAMSNAKNRLLDAAAFAQQANDFYERSIARAYTAYEKILRSNDALDFDDLLLLTARMLRNDEPVRSELQERFQYLLIDEYQDTNHAQFVIAAALAAGHRNICVVGDPDQSIYGWRGADIRNILEFEQQYPETTIIPLGQNFRSTAHIVAAADHLIRHNTQRKHKPLHTELDEGEMPTVLTCGDERHEASLIVDEFRGLSVEQSVAWKDMAVLYRINALSRVVEEAFRDAQIPYIVARGTAFYERKEIKDAISYLRLVANPSDEIALRRIINTPARGIGRTTIDRIEMHALNRSISFYDALREVERIDALKQRAVGSVQKFVTMIEGWRAFALDRDHDLLPETAGDASQRLAALVERVVRESGMEHLYRTSKAEEDYERLENLEELISAAAQFEPTIDEEQDTDEAAAEGRTWTTLEMLGAYLESVALVSDADAIDPTSGAVTLMTLHAAKGLEFDAVAIIGLEDGLLPHSRAAQSETELEEERRLCFVGMTRAKRHLMLTRAKMRTHRGLRERTIPSMFLGELPDDVTVTSDRSDEVLELEPFDDDAVYGGGSAASAFPVGSIVRHPTFGLGRVETVISRPVGASARVSFETVGVKTLILDYAKLERVQ